MIYNLIFDFWFNVVTAFDSAFSTISGIDLNIFSFQIPNFLTIGSLLAQLLSVATFIVLFWSVFVFLKKLISFFYISIRR